MFDNVRGKVGLNFKTSEDGDGKQQMVLEKNSVSKKKQRTDGSDSDSWERSLRRPPKQGKNEESHGTQEKQGKARKTSPETFPDAPKTTNKERRVAQTHLLDGLRQPASRIQTSTYSPRNERANAWERIGVDL